MAIPLITHPDYSFDFPGKHRFPMEKFRLLHQHLQMLGFAKESNTYRPGRTKLHLLELAHCPDYLHRFIHQQQSPQEVRRMGLPWSPALVKRTLISPNGTLLTATLALQHGVACHLAGGTHHAHRDFASGFCILNDLAITALSLLKAPRMNESQPRSVLIFDCDVHQGDGTAAILQHEPQAFTCSIHCEKNFPARKAVSDFDVEIQEGCGDDLYLSTVERALHEAIDRSKPGLIIFDAGVDVYADDPLGLLNITIKGIRARERLVLETCRRKGLPVATVIGGGYDNDRQALIQRHSLVVEEAFSIFEPYNTQRHNTHRLS